MTKSSDKPPVLLEFAAKTAEVGLGDEWFPIMTGWEHKRRRQNDLAIRFLTFATNRFPQSPDAFQNLSEGLEAAGRIEEAQKAILRAEALDPKDNPYLTASIQEAKSRLQKLRPAEGQNR